MEKSTALPRRLRVKVGESVQLGDAAFRIAAVLVVEPDRMTGTLNAGPRLMVTREGLDRANLIRAGSRASQRYLFHITDPQISVETVHRRLTRTFADARVVDFRETHPTIRRGLERATKFLSLVSLVALIVGGLGVAMAIHSHIQQRLDSIAVMKCLGARSSQIMEIYIIQTVGLGLAGSLTGVAVGYLMQTWAPRLIANYFPDLPALDWDPLPAIQAVVIGLLVTLLFTVPPLWGIRRVRPAVIFRRDTEGPLSFRQRWNRWKPWLGVGVAIVAIIAGLAASLSDSRVLGAWFAGGLVVSLIALAVFAAVLLRGLKRFAKSLPSALPQPIRHGIANLSRPGMHAEAILVALGIGVTFTLSVFLIQTSVLSQMLKSAPPEMPNVFFLNITSDERDGLLALVKTIPGVDAEPELVSSTVARLVSINGNPIDDLPESGDGPDGEDDRRRDRYRTTQTITWMDAKPDYIDILQGEWWQPGVAPEGGESLISVQDWSADRLKIKLGDRIDWQVGGAEVKARVTAIHRAEGIRPGGSIQFVLNREALAGMPALYYGGLRVAPDRAPEIQRIVFEQFPTITVINAADVLNIVQDVVDQIGLVVRFVSAFAIFGGIIILVSSVIATRIRRIREVAILKTLGATKRRIANIFSVEFLLLGATAGLMGSLLATGFSNLVLEQVLDSEFQFDWLPNAITVIGTALLANAAGWLASSSILGKKPIEVLREE
jgi:putative ABC transport system permease protein